MFVQCSECGEKHKADEAEFVNIEEDFLGRDLLTFICPKTKQQSQSLVYNEPNEGMENDF